MPVNFKGITEYQNKYKGRVVRSRSASPQRRMRWAGLRSDQLGISREPQFLSKRKVPSSHTAQVSSSFQWNPTTTETQRRWDENTRARPRTPERAQTPLGPRGGPNVPTGDHQPGPNTLQPDSGVPLVQTETRSPLAAVERQDSAFNGVQHVLRRKAGLMSSEKRAGLLKTEYDNQFQWKTPVACHASPLLAAEQGRRKQKREQKERTHSDAQDNITVSRPPEQQEVKSQSSRKLPHPHRRMKTEYRSNFRPPLNYTCKDGAWVKVTSGGSEVRELREKAEAYKRRAWGTHFSRLHFNQILSDQNQLWEASTPSSADLTPGTASGDGEDDRGCSPTIQGLDLARLSSVEGSSSSISRHPASVTPVSSGRSSVKGAEGTAGPTGAPAVRRQLAWEENVGTLQRKERRRTEEKEEEEEEEDVEPRNELRKERQNEQMLQDHVSVWSSGGSHSPVEGGRLPTPTLQRIATIQRTHHDLTTPATGTRTHHDLTTPATGTRTHHDLTTPATGGAILVSPPKLKECYNRARSESPLGKPSPPFRHWSQASQKGVPPQDQKPVLRPSPPAAGMSTEDPLPLREDSWLEEIAQENPPDPPPQAKRPRERTTSGDPHMNVPPPVNRIQGSLRDPEFQHNGNLGLRTSELLLGPNDGCGSNGEDDRMSQISSRSMASCSRASEVLGRAQRRKEDFWGKR